MEDAFDRELLELAMQRVEKRVKPANWQAFRLTALEERPGAEAAKELGLSVARVDCHRASTSVVHAAGIGRSSCARRPEDQVAVGDPDRQLLRSVDGEKYGSGSVVLSTTLGNTTETLP